MRIDDKQVFVVRGSEDGVLGVFTTIRKAWEVAVHYAENEPHIYIGMKTHDDGRTESIYHRANYRNVSKHINSHGYATVEERGLNEYGSHGNSADISRFYLNNY